jgi:hypothetical protein
VRTSIERPEIPRAAPDHPTRRAASTDVAAAASSGQRHVVGEHLNGVRHVVQQTAREIELAGEPKHPVNFGENDGTRAPVDDVEGTEHILNHAAVLTEACSRPAVKTIGPQGNLYTDSDRCAVKLNIPCTGFSAGPTTMKGCNA